MPSIIRGFKRVFMITAEKRHEETIVELSEKYKSEGYSILSQPPFPLHGYIPDLIVSNQDSGFIIEVDRPNYL